VIFYFTPDTCRHPSMDLDLSVFLLLKAPLRISDTTRKMIINQQVLYIIEMRVDF